MPLSIAGSAALTGTEPMAAKPTQSSDSGLGLLRRALDEVWLANEARLTRLAIGLSVGAAQAADVVHDVYVAAIERPPPIDDPDELLRWLVRVTVNRCRLEYRRRGRWQRLWSALALGWRSYETGGQPNLGELPGDVARALTTLNPDERELVVMRYFSDLNSRQIAEIVGIPETTVRTRLRAARRKLAVELEDWNDDA